MAILIMSTVLVLIIAAGVYSLDDPTVSERMAPSPSLALPDPSLTDTRRRPRQVVGPSSGYLFP